MWHMYKQSRSCQLPFCASPIFHFEIGDFSVYMILPIVVLYHIFTPSHNEIWCEQVGVIHILKFTHLVNACKSPLQCVWLFL